MKSPRGLTAAVVFLLALPVTLLYQEIVGDGAEIVIHAALALGSVLMAFAVSDFSTRSWMNWGGRVSIGILAAIFFLQGLSHLIQNATLTHFAYQVLGQRMEGWLVDLFLLWCIAVLLLDSHGRTKVLGLIALSTAVCVEAYAIALTYRGSSLQGEAPGLKALFLLPFVWLVLESCRRRQPIEGKGANRLGIRG